MFDNSFNVVQGSNRRRQWHPTPVLLAGKSHGRRGLVMSTSPFSMSVPLFLPCKALKIFFVSLMLTAAAAAAAAKSLQLCPTLCDPIDGSPLGFSIMCIRIGLSVSCFILRCTFENSSLSSIM